MNFEQSLEYLLSLGFELSVKKFGLENTTVLLEALGNPERGFLKVQIAGTNGKGSTCAFLESICLAAGLKVGVNTSPHLVSITERVRIGGNDISEEEFARLATHVKKVSEELVRDGRLQALPTYFEHVTAIALTAFAEAGVDIAILETGLGGRFDAVTAANSEIAGITPIDMDHVKTLGPTLADIAGEKAAVIRPGVAVAISAQTDIPALVLSERCVETGVKPRFASEIRIEAKPPERFGDSNVSGETVIVAADADEIGTVRLGLAGKHQIENARTAVLLARMVSERGISIPDSAVLSGLSGARHPGRLEFSNGVLFDGAHNEAGALVLREYLEQNIEKRLTILFAAMGGKDVSKMARILFGLAESVIVTTPENPRAMPSSEIAEVVQNALPDLSVSAIDDIGDAFEEGLRRAEDGLLLVTGSLYLIGEIKAWIAGNEMRFRTHRKV